MNPDLLIALFNNAAILLVLGLIYQVGFTVLRRAINVRPLLNGVLISLIGIAVMSTAFELRPGLVYDTRSILISLTALMFGPVTTAVTVVALAAYRISAGGMGMLPGLAVISTSAALGLLWRHFFSGRLANGLRWLYLYLLGLIVHIVMLACMLILPWPQSREIIREIAFPILVIYPLATVLLGLVLLQQKDQIAARRRLEESEKLFRDVVSGAPDAIFILIDDRIVFTNQAAEDLFGTNQPKEIIGRQIKDFICQEEPVDINNNPARQFIEITTSAAVEKIYRRLDGRPVNVEVSSVPIVYQQSSGIMVFARDISLRKHLEQEQQEIEIQLRQQQKLEAIGTLAGGVAHEINNPLNGIMNLAQLILDDLQPDTQHASYLRQIISETRRISEIVKNLLQFSRQDLKSQSLALTEDIISQTLSLLGSTLKKDQIELEVTIADGIPPLRCRSQQIQQVLMNLLTNARDALNEKYPGFDKNKRIIIHAGSFKQNETQWIRITIKDFGTGIPASVQGKIMEPFFSTKPKEKGTGLGLAISFGIVRDHHGNLTYDSREGEYTRVIIDLPVTGNLNMENTGDEMRSRR